MKKTIEISRDVIEAACRELERGDGPGPRNRAQELRAILADSTAERPEPVGEVRVVTSGNRTCYEGVIRANAILEGLVESGTKLYTSPPAPLSAATYDDGFADGLAEASLYMSAPVSPLLPNLMEMRPFQTVDRGSTNYKAGFNACIKQTEELNACIDKVKELNQ